MMDATTYDIICIITSALMVGISIPQIYRIPYLAVCISGIVSVAMRSYRLLVGQQGMYIKNVLWFMDIICAVSAYIIVFIFCSRKQKQICMVSFVLMIISLYLGLVVRDKYYRGRYPHALAHIINVVMLSVLAL